MQETDPEVIEYDPEPERTLKKNLRAKKKREAMAALPRRTMGDYCKRSDTKEISLGFRPVHPVNFDIKGITKEWLQCLPSGTIQTWKELEDKFLERFFNSGPKEKGRHNELQAA
ncbi:hypothetical protein L195_g016418 [Trifolium pratense]|uniref:Retrotransposon gag domain-containing protein n=1 Tax=Trifolium pratense TaxID=57577 RepID=A0A2K3MR71_TRIPR|nr:hypothetical protein L195_g016418 [Trifolium pratense]